MDEVVLNSWIKQIKKMPESKVGKRGAFWGSEEAEEGDDAGKGHPSHRRVRGAGPAKCWGGMGEILWG